MNAVRSSGLDEDGKDEIDRIDEEMKMDKIKKINIHQSGELKVR